jgi:3-mercaptopyruvate sulfurtransferase SseA
MIDRRSLFAALAGVLGARRVIAQGPPSAPDLAKVPRITLKEFRALHAKKAVLAIDVRDPHGFDSGHIPGALNVSFVDVEIMANRLLKEKRPIVAYCA